MQVGGATFCIINRYNTYSVPSSLLSLMAFKRSVSTTPRSIAFLQYSMGDLMAALKRAGCATRLLIEQRDHTTVPAHTYMQAFADFQPDLVLMIDHHRYKRPDAFVADVPMVCWIQDELPSGGLAINARTEPW